MIYRGNGWEIREGRWQDSAPNSVDVVISDPPYDERTHAGGRRADKQPNGICEATIKSFAPLDPADITFQLIMHSRRWVVLFCAAEMIGDYALYSRDAWVRCGWWIKTDPTPQFSGDRPATPGDAIAIMHNVNRRKRWNGGGKAGAWKFRTARGDERNHETPKPVDLMLALVSDFSDPSELVWDPYCGSGTTGVACLRLGRRFLGHEMQPHYAKIAAERLAAEERGLTLQDVKRGQTSILDVIGDDDG